jgi:hypothetical protein
MTFLNSGQDINFSLGMPFWIEGLRKEIIVDGKHHTIPSNPPLTSFSPREALL